MGVNYFTEEQLQELQNNPFVERASEKGVTYSEEFKERFMIGLEDGKLPMQIFKEAGFDTKALGQVRISGFARRIRTMNGRAEGFKDMRSENSGRSRNKVRTLEEENDYLKHQIALQKQQIYALKKTNIIKRKAAKASHKNNTDSSKN